jgi:long-chain acyl-CoA synthetase
MEDQTTLIRIFLERVRDRADEVIYTHKFEGKWTPVTWKEYGEKVEEIALALTSLGIQKEDRVAILAKPRWEWYYFHMGILVAGGITIGIYQTDPANQCKYIINHSGARFILAEDQEQADKIISCWDEMPELEWMFLIEKYKPKDHPKIMKLSHLHEIGKREKNLYPLRLEEIVLLAKPDDLVTIVYTSGTTGPPKGAMITHRNVLYVVKKILEVLPFQYTDRILDLLPLAHVGGQIWGSDLHLYSSIPGFIAEDYNEVIYNAWETEATYFVSTPRLFEKFYNRIQIMIDDATWIQRWSYQEALKIGAKVAELRQSKKGLPIFVRILHFFADQLIFRKVRKILGGKIRFVTSGGAPISAKIIEFAEIVGIRFLEAFGMTETLGFTTTNRLDDYRIGSVGKPIPGTNIQIADDGELLIQSPANCLGYWKDPEASEKLLAGGWLHTGDVGVIDEDGYLFITDRKKDIFITAGGKNVAPGNVENLLKTSKYISQAMIYGDKKKYLTCLLTLDEEEVTKYERDKKIIYKDTKELTQRREIYELIQREVQGINKDLASVETVKRFVILSEELDQDKEEVTATQKVKRKILTEKYKEQLEALYKD